MKLNSLLMALAVVTAVNLGAARTAGATTVKDTPSLAAVYVNDTRYVFARGLDNQIYYAFGDGWMAPTTPTWVGMGGAFNSCPQRRYLVPE